MMGYLLLKFSSIKASLDPNIGLPKSKKWIYIWGKEEVTYFLGFMVCGMCMHWVN